MTSLNKEKNPMAGIGRLVGRRTTPEDESKLTEAQRSHLAEASYGLRHYGYGPFTAVFVDDSGIERKLHYSEYSERAVEGAAHIVQRAIGVVQRIPARPKTFQEAFDRRDSHSEKLQLVFAGLANYRIGFNELGNMDHLLDLDLRTVKIMIRNNAGKLVYKSGA